MFEKLRIKEHMEVAGSDGEHVGTIDEVDGERLKLTKTDASDHQHHYIPFDMVEKVAENRVWLKVPKAQAMALKV